jgi:hypothetical protein
MKIIRITSTSILALLLGVAAPLYGQHDQQGEKQDHQGQKQEQHEQAKPESQHAQQRPSGQKQTQNHQQQEHAQQQKQAQNNQQQEHAQQQKQAQNHQQQEHAQQQKQAQNNQHAQQQRNDRPRTQAQQHVQQSAWQQHRSQHWESDHRTWQQRGGYKGYRIPDNRYRGYFGQDHAFRISGLPFLVVGGYPRFQYSGYWFSPVDPWPEYWGANWYDNDDVYVMYVDNGYYMYNRRYPTEGIAIRISL